MLVIEPVVELMQLQELTQGNKELQICLFELFCSSSKENIAFLKKNCLDKDDIQWKINTNILKGASKNIGALTLCTICEQAVEAYNAPAQIKLNHFKAIENEYLKVKSFIMNHLNDYNHLEQKH